MVARSAGMRAERGRRHCVGGDTQAVVAVAGDNLLHSKAVVVVESHTGVVGMMDNWVPQSVVAEGDK